MNDQRGQVLILTAIGMAVLLGFTGLAVDVGYAYFQRRELARLADAAALVGAQRNNGDRENPAILQPEGPQDAGAYAELNGLQAGDEITVRVPPADDPDDPTDDSAPWNGDDEYIEVRVFRQVDTFFSRVLGFQEWRIGAQAVARATRPGAGEFSIMTLDRGPDSLTRDGAGPCAGIYGDVYSRGRHTANGYASWCVEGSVWSLDGEIDQNPDPGAIQAWNVCANDGSCAQVPDVPDPFANWTPPTANPPDSGPPHANVTFIAPCPDQPDRRCREDVTGDGESGWGRMRVQPASSVRLGSLTPGGGGKYRQIEINTLANATLPQSWLEGGEYDITQNLVLSGDVHLEPGVYHVGGSLTFSSGAQVTAGNACAPGQGAIFVVDGDVRSSGNASFEIFGDPDYGYVAIFARGNVTLTGTGDRVIHGSVYSPTGTATVAGNGDQAAIQRCPDDRGGGQLIAWRVALSGGGPVVDGPDPGSGFVFSPALVNKPIP